MCQNGIIIALVADITNYVAFTVFISESVSAGWSRLLQRKKHSHGGKWKMWMWYFNYLMDYREICSVFFMYFVLLSYFSLSISLILPEVLSRYMQGFLPTPPNAQ